MFFDADADPGSRIFLPWIGDGKIKDVKIKSALSERAPMVFKFDDF